MARTVKVEKVTNALTSKGMVSGENHHHMFRKNVDGVTTLVTRISHSSKEINEHLAGLMARQCCLQKAEFWNLVDCPLSEAEWDALVRERCRDGKNPFLP